MGKLECLNPMSMLKHHKEKHEMNKSLEEKERDRQKRIDACRKNSGKGNWRWNRYSSRVYVRQRIEKIRGPWNSKRKNAIAAYEAKLLFEERMAKKYKSWESEFMDSRHPNQRAAIEKKVTREKKDAETERERLDTLVNEIRKER
ncbi:hypothetical protein ACMFMG_005940 [Clarireedia jacksonii]